MSKFINIIAIITLFLIIIVVWSTFPFWTEYIFNIPKDRDSQGLLGTFGDSFGALNTLFSGLAFSGIIISIFLQSKELSETRGEIKEQSVQFSLQTKALNRQVFENTFFQLVSLHNEILKDVSYQSKNGRDAFDQLYHTLKGRLKYDSFENMDDELKAANEAYAKFYAEAQNEIGHYFRNLYHIIKFVDSSSVDDKKQYTNIIRAQLSNFELAILFYNCLSPLGNEKFKPLIEKYSMFKTIPPGILLRPRFLRPFYAPSAFG